MYPFIRMVKELVVHSRAGSLPVEGVHVSRHICWPWDLDLWLELNNGRTLTLFDLGRIPLGRRTGLVRAIRANGWGLTVAGVSMRYRRRIRVFDRIEMRSRTIGWDNRFLYLEQSMWKKGEATTHGLYRVAVTSREGIVPPPKVAEQMGHGPASPPLPDWVQHWITAEAERPWPPQM
ncbi:acyl-CoA thioesterase [Sinisalibacter aestuarii]|uniref:Thioesterase n=1 Tax=Sinisalibacter aestuarii TaxID=2949426 RepID=A0ABQ5LV22_9RHOB|nr:acyl-CoA thioesterase [Sinisalibacter aestuarii]GKY88831.1 thioesterase [Sinisalibacter aestuarii]